MTAAAFEPEDEARSIVAALLPLMAAVFVVFLVTGVALPALPLHVHDRLGLGAFAVGLVGGSQFAASLVSRVWSGAYSDARGAKRAVIAGLLMAAGAGMLYLASLHYVGAPLLSAAILIVGRGLLGGGESFVIVGAQSWGLALAGPKHTGKVMAWLGMAMYLAFAAGAPLGSALFERYGFPAIALATTLVPIATLAAIAPLAPVAPRAHARLDPVRVAAAVAAPGLGLAFASVGFGGMTAFSVLLFVERGWRPAWLSFTLFAVAFVIARLWLGHLADRIGGAKVALIFALIEAAGLVLIGLAPWAGLGFAGAAVTGFGYSLVFPGLGVEAVRRAPPESQGLAVGAYTAFLDLALGALVPALGFIASVAGLGSVFVIGAVLSACAVPIAARLAAGANPKGEPT
jgi:MFS family permease